MLTITKPAAIVRFEKAELERYSRSIEEEFDSIEEAEKALPEVERLNDFGVGFEIIYRDAQGALRNYAGDIVQYARSASDQNQIISDAFAFFRAVYTRELTDALIEIAKSGTLDQRITNGIIDGDLLTVVDMASGEATREEYEWRVGYETLHEAFQEAGPDVYEGIDYPAIIAKARAFEA